jgi:chromosome partitioning protein
VRVVTLLNQKGGVGKTSTCHHLAGTLALLGKRVLLLDNDPQASLTQGFWGPQATRQLDPSRTIAALYNGDLPYPDQVVQPTGLPGIDLLPGSRYATPFNLPEPQLQSQERQLCIRELLSGVEPARYDLALIDCPPNLHLCSWAALAACDELIVPLQPEDYGAQGIIDVQESVDLVRHETGSPFGLLGYLITMVNPRKTLHKLYEQTLRTQFGGAVFETMVPHATDYPEAIAARKPVAQYKPKGQAAKAMKALADEVLARLDSRGISTREVA